MIEDRQKTVKNRSTHRLQRWLGRILHQGVDMIFPPACAGCGLNGVEWCSACDQSIVRLTQLQSLPLALNEINNTADIPGSMPDFIQVISYSQYAGPIIQAILSLKYLPNGRLADVMAGWLESILPMRTRAFDLLVPVPLAVKRKHQRGYNQVELITKQLAKRIRMNLIPLALQRSRDTGSQVGRQYQDRMVNVRNAFLADREIVARKRIVLVDDVTTTGATLIACSRAMFNAGAEEVVGLTVARA